MSKDTSEKNCATGIVYNRSFGFGAATRITDMGGNIQIADVKFNGGEKKMIASMLADVPEEILIFTEQDEFADYFDTRTLKKGYEYFRDDHVRNITYDPKTFEISAEVLGTKKYITTLTFQDGFYSGECTCPVGFECKHTAAVFYKLQKVFLELEELVPEKTAGEESRDGENDAISYFSPGTDLHTLTQKLNNDRKNYFYTVRAIADTIAADCRQSGVKTYIDAITEGPLKVSRTDAEELIIALVFNRNTRDTLDEVMKGNSSLRTKNLAGIYKFASRLVSDDGKLSKYASVDNAFKFCFYNHEWRGAVEAAFYCKASTVMGDTVKALVDENSNVGEVADTLCEFLISRSDNGEYTDFILKRLKKADLSGRERKAAKALYSVASPYNKQSTTKLIDEVTSRLPYSQYIEKFINSKKAYRGIRGAYYKKDELSSPRVGENVAVDSRLLYTYFERKYAIAEEKNSAVVVYALALPDVAAYAVQVLEDPDGNLRVLENCLEGGKYGPVAAKLVEDVKAERGDDIAAALVAKQKEIDERVYAEKLRELNYGISEFASSLPAPQIIYSNAIRADVDFCFTRKYDDKWFLELKVGIKRKYVVKDIASFLSAFFENSTVRYGKELELTHNYDNLREGLREPLEFLMTVISLYSSPYYVRDFRTIQLTSHVLYHLLLTLKGKYVYIGDAQYLVTLDEVPISVSVDSNYVLKCRCKSLDFVACDAGLIVVDEKDKRIDFVTCEPQSRQLYLFTAKNSGINMEPVKDRFRDEIYSRFYPYINISPTVADSFKLSSIDINAYFDWDNGAVTVKTALQRDGNTVAEGSVTLPQDKAKLTNYLCYIGRMGFNEGRLEDQTKILNFFSMDMSELKKYCNVYLSDAISSKKLQTFSRQTLRISYDSGIMESFNENSDYTDEELAAILKAVRKKRKFILLLGDRIIDISGNDAEEFEATVSDMKLDEQKLSGRNRISIVQALKAFAHDSNCRVDGYLSKMIDDIRSFKQYPAEVPNLNAELRSYQVEGFKWLKTISDYGVGGVLADDMGLGKTIEIITLLKSDTKEKPNLIVCPKSLVFNWINEFHRFDTEAEVCEIYGTPSSRKELISGIDYNEKITYVTSYDSLRNDLEFYSGAFNYLVLDEAQFIKNVKSKKSISVKSVTADHRLALTGTPIENSVLDLWSIFDFIMPGYFEDVSDFKSRYANEKSYAGLIAKRIAPFVLRRTKQDVLKDLPDKYERIYSVEMTAEQRKVYDAYKKDAAERLKEGATAFDVLPYLMRLRQICDDPGMFIDDYTGGSGKLDSLLEIIKEYTGEGHRILVFSQFVTGLDRASELLTKAGIQFYTITGDTPSKERIRLMDEFNAGVNVPVFLISLKAGGTGLNLTGADTVIHMDPWWNVAAENQATDRAHRIGQVKNVEVIKLICENSVEQRVIELQNTKKDIIDSIISSSDKSVTSATLEDISFILG